MDFRNNIQTSARHLTPILLLTLMVLFTACDSATGIDPHESNEPAVESDATLSSMTQVIIENGIATWNARLADLKASDTASTEEIAFAEDVLLDLNKRLSQPAENRLDDLGSDVYDAMCIAKSVKAFSGHRVTFQTEDGIALRTDVRDGTPMIFIPLGTTAPYRVTANEQARQGDENIEIVFENDSLSEDGGWLLSY